MTTKTLASTGSIGKVYEVYVPFHRRGGANSFYFRIEKVAQAWLAATLRNWEKKNKRTRPRKPELRIHSNAPELLTTQGQWPETYSTARHIAGDITTDEVRDTYAKMGW